MKALMKIAVVLLVASVAAAGPSLQVEISAGSYYDYVATVVTGPVGVYDVGQSFRTFCLERNESTGDDVFNVAITNAAFNGGLGGGGIGGDPLDSKTAFLYNEFLNGGLGGTGFTGSDEDLKVLQNVIWELEEEGAVVGGTLFSNLLAYANTAEAGEDYGIRVMNMTYLNGEIAQDMLVKVIPTPGAVVLGGIGVSVVGWLRRRKKD